MINIHSNQKLKITNFDLEERTAVFAERIIRFAKKLVNTPENIPLKTQLVRAGTSIGANYYEAAEAQSKKDFVHKIAISKKETKETKFWLRVIGVANPDLKEEARSLWKEAHELNLIFAAAIRTATKNG